MAADLDAAIGVAVAAHRGQNDKQDEPYILHPLAVMLAVPDFCRAVAVLHDVMEDNRTWDLPRIEARVPGLSLDEQRALQVLTRPPAGIADRPTYDEYIDRIADTEGYAGVIARRVKKADIEHNLKRMGKLAGMRDIDEGEIVRLTGRYNRALGRLEIGNIEATTRKYQEEART